MVLDNLVPNDLKIPEWLGMAILSYLYLPRLGSSSVVTDGDPSQGLNV